MYVQRILCRKMQMSQGNVLLHYLSSEQLYDFAQLFNSGKYNFEFFLIIPAAFFYSQIELV